MKNAMVSNTRKQLKNKQTNKLEKSKFRLELDPSQPSHKLR